MSDSIKIGERSVKLIENASERWPNPTSAGFMWKYTIVMKRVVWRKRYFILDRSGLLFYFKGKNSKKPRKDPVNIKDVKFWISNIRRNCLEIERHPKQFFVFCEDYVKFKRWIIALRESGGIFSPYQNECEPLVPEIVSKANVSTWTNEQVADWLSMIPVSRNDTLSLYENHFTAINGKSLLTMEKERWSQVTLANQRHGQIMGQCIHDLNTSKVFDYSYQIMLRKLLKLTETGHGRHFRIELCQGIIEKLSDRKQMAASYLNLEDEGYPEKYLESILEPLEGEESFDDEDVAHESLDLQKDQKQRLTMPHQMKSKSDRNFLWPIRVFLMDTTPTSEFNGADSLLSPKLSHFPKYVAPFGDNNLRVVVIVGKFYLEWNQASLVIPRQLTFPANLIDHISETIGVIEDMSFIQIVERLSRVISLWNRTKEYCEKANTSKPHLGNPQQFVDDVLRIFGLSLPGSKYGAMAKYLDLHRVNGKAGLEFHPSHMFQEKFKEVVEDREVIVFETHFNLDVFVSKCKKVDKVGFGMDFREEVAVLKWFDRVFWMRHLNNLLEDAYQPLPLGLSSKTTEECEGDAFPIGCPFGDVRSARGSIWN